MVFSSDKNGYNLLFGLYLTRIVMMTYLKKSQCAISCKAAITE
jgi:hypothetical protein